MTTTAMLVVAAAVALAGCKRKEEPAAPPDAAAPVDHFVKGEIPEGSERAFTLPLPLHSTVKARFERSVHVASEHTPDELTRFVQLRVKDGKVVSVGNDTSFDRVVVVKDASRTLTIQIRPAAVLNDYKSQLVVDDVTLPPEQPGTTDADRWRKAGMTPDGKLIDREKRE